MAETSKFVINASTAEEIAFNLYKIVEGRISMHESRSIGKDEALNLYAECLETVLYPERRLSS
jgi:hypothetical protein